MKLIKRLDPPAVLAMLFVSAIVLFGGFGIASAASFTNVEFSNGDVTIQGNGGQTVSAKLRIVVGAGEVVEKVQHDVISDGLAPVCVAVGGSKGLEEGTHFVDIQVKLPPNTGTYSLDVQGSGIFGAFTTVDCTSDVVGSASFGGALKVVGSSSSSSGGSIGLGGVSFQDLLDMIKELTLQIAALKAAPAVPAKPAYCASMTWYNGSNAWLAQASLLASPHASGFHAIGVFQPTGFWGPVSSAANAAASVACK